MLAVVKAAPPWSTVRPGGKLENFMPDTKQNIEIVCLFMAGLYDKHVKHITIYMLKPTRHICIP